MRNYDFSELKFRKKAQKVLLNYDKFVNQDLLLKVLFRIKQHLAIFI